jgi:NAD-dependent SIR2 family protein deacetylase
MAADARRLILTTLLAALVSLAVSVSMSVSCGRKMAIFPLGGGLRNNKPPNIGGSRRLASCLSYSPVNNSQVIGVPVVRSAQEGATVLGEWLSRQRSVCVLTGAGVSVESGIPDYRGPNGSYSRGHKPMTHDEFMGDVANRRRYYARSTIGWEQFNQANPNDAHKAVAKLEARGTVLGVITQNVDALHQKAGSVNVIDLHGQNARVVCMDCGLQGSRRILQKKLSQINRDWLDSLKRAAELHGDELVLHADGDSNLRGMDTETFEICNCDRCGGILKPDVVFFGGSVPRDRVEHAFSMVEQADALLVLGTSLQVYSGFRFAERAAKLNKSIAIVNMGPTRAEKARLPITLKVEASVGTVLAGAVENL